MELNNKMKFELNRLSDYSKESLIEEIKRVNSIVNLEHLTISNFLKHSKVHNTTLKNKFGSWKKALIAAGLENKIDKSNEHKSNEHMISLLKNTAKKLNKNTLTKGEFEKNCDKIHSSTIINNFGSWLKALKAAGLKVTNLGKRYTDEECFENLLKVWTHYGRPPQYKEMKEYPSSVGPKAYIIRWKTWNNALQAFVDKINSDVKTETTSVDESIETIQNLKTKSKKIVKVEDLRDIKLGLRFKVLHRDNFKCVYCGKSPATHINCELHIDHIEPFSKGGKTKLENLQTSCKECNLGKSNKII